MCHIRGGKSSRASIVSKLRNGFLKLKPCCEEGVSRTWSCAQARDYVEGASNAPRQNAMLLLNRNRIKKNLSLEGNSSGKLKKSGSNSSQLMSEWSIKQGARQRRPRYQEIMILDHIQDMKTLQGRGWLIIFLYLSYQFKISSELEILWDRLLEVYVAVYTWILWELWVGMREAHVYILVQRTLGFLWDERT